MPLYQLQSIIGENLLKFLRVNGYTKTSLAKMTGISRPTINQIVEGKSPNPKIYEEQIQKITDAFNLPIDYFTYFSDVQQEKWHLPSTQYSDRSTFSNRNELTKDLLSDLDELLTVATFYIKG
ncbi:helix-turn-helix transcriptional regulator [Rossellomorea vietnamensis]|uniref:Helix-turn-helix transcriptional regulator n=1 Tax=Rossellomorea vietnamensis TaxID=218284 RepID=A0A5D4KAL1_9BACI|nr:helix-turn-helix transcriptional regulator [Rossellomorea vietnamensis]TYR74397.1 helix-turn-helix transcriptional regulator [Rossellomorea vietnamensis]